MQFYGSVVILCGTLNGVHLIYQYQDCGAKAGAIASHVYGDPSGKLWLIGVTGTNGKTSCVQWIAQALTNLGIKTASIGTLGHGFSGELRPAVNTTPRPDSITEKDG